MIKVGIVGYGFSAQTFHLPFLTSTYSDLSQLRFTAISTSKPKEVKREYPNVEVFSTPEELILHGDVDLIVITSPNDTHYELAKACLTHHKHVVIEKPMAITFEQCMALSELANANNLLLSVFHNRRWDGDFLTVKSLLKSNAIGDVKVFESHFDRFRPIVRKRWREQKGQGTGILYDLGSHLIDQAICLFGMPNAVTARCLALRAQSEVVDYFNVQLHYNRPIQNNKIKPDESIDLAQSQFEVVLNSSPFSANPNPRFKIQGTLGAYIVDGLDPQEAQLKAGLDIVETEFGSAKEEHFGRVYSQDQESMVNDDIMESRIATQKGDYKQFYIQVVSAITHHSDNPVTPHSAANVVRIIELAEQSALAEKTLSV